MIPSQGLAGLTAQPKGGLPASSSGGQAMAKYFDLAKKLSDGQLADVMAGKSMDVPQFVAMTEAMGRRQLRQAVEGAQAQAQAQQPTVKDQLLADYQQGRQAHMIPAQRAAGIDQLPADNMVALGEGHATGGIISFDGGGDVPGFYKGGDPWAEQRVREEDPNVFMSKAWFKKHFEGAGGLSGSKSAERKADIAAQQKLNARENPEFGEPILRTDEDPYGQTNQANQANQVIPNSAPGVTEPPVAPAAPPEKKNYLTQGQGQNPYTRRASPFGQFNPEAIDYNKLKDQGLGQAMLGASKALLSKRGAAGFGEAFENLGLQAAATRKEMQGLKKDDRDYKLNLAKANELFEQGQDDLAYKYLAEANLNRYHMAMANKPDAGIAMLNALKDPANMKVYQQMYGARKPMETVSREKALANWKSVPLTERQKKFGDDFENYYNYVNNRLLTDTIGDGVVLGKV